MIVDEQGNAPAYPIKQCTRCGNSVCKLAMDSHGSLLMWLSTLQYVNWPDVQKLPGWINGWPPGTGPNNNYAAWIPIDLVGPMVNRVPISDSRPKCDCGAAKADYSISAQGGPGHSDWCKVYGK